MGGGGKGRCDALQHHLDQSLRSLTQPLPIIVPARTWFRPWVRVRLGRAPFDLGGRLALL